MPYDSFGEKHSLRLLVFLVIVAIVRGIVSVLGKASLIRGGEKGRLRDFYVKSRLRRRHLDLGVNDNITKTVNPLEYLARMFRFRR